MNGRIAAVVVSMGLALAPATARAEEKAEPLPSFGLGVGLGIGNTYTGGTPATPPVSILATFNLSDSFRLEPNFGFWVVSKGATASTILGTAAGSEGGYGIQAGLGAFYLMRPLKQMALYGGGRIGLIFTGASATVQNVDVNVSEMSLYVAPALGFEWWIVRAFSLGGELQIPLRWYFDPTISGGGTSTTVSTSKFGTGFEALIFMRFYL
jgi:hypothetical protein